MAPFTRALIWTSTPSPRRCVTAGCEGYLENTDWDRGFMVAGAWTHGKFVLLDAMINNQDWAVGVTPAAHSARMMRCMGDLGAGRPGSGARVGVTADGRRHCTRGRGAPSRGR